MNDKASVVLAGGNDSCCVRQHVERERLKRQTLPVIRFFFFRYRFPRPPITAHWGNVGFSGESARRRRALKRTWRVWWFALCCLFSSASDNIRSLCLNKRGYQDDEDNTVSKQKRTHPDSLASRFRRLCHPGHATVGVANTTVGCWMLLFR